MSIIQKLTEGIVNRNLEKEGQAMLKKWEKTGLLEGITNERERAGMALLLENQAKELLREATAMSQGDVEGFAAVAFPLVRRVFGNLIANELVSVQPMSLPSGLIFFLDFKYTDKKPEAGATNATSMYGGGVVGSQITGGVDLTSVSTSTQLWALEKGFYSLNNGYASATGSVSATLTPVAARSGSGAWQATAQGASLPAEYKVLGDSLILNDPDLSGSSIVVFTTNKSNFTYLNTSDYVTLHRVTTGRSSGFSIVRRLTRHCPLSGSSKLLVVFATYNSGSVDSTSLDYGIDISGSATWTYTYTDTMTTGTGLGSVVGTYPWGLEGTATLGTTGVNSDIPEIDMKVDSIAVTATTKKLKARWTPELAQDLNAYHNLDAEVELTSVLSEQIALEVDQEILNDLIKTATAATYFWSRKPGKFVDKTTGASIATSTYPDFTGTVSAWYETLIETMNDVSAQIHRKTLRGGATFAVCGPEVANILEFTAGFRADVTHDEDKGSVGTVKIGSINKKWDLFVDPYFPRNVILLGRKGGSFLETGYVYAPYVPLQITPTIFGTEDFTPRKGIMTRYARRSTKPDMYGLVIVADLLMAN